METSGGSGSQQGIREFKLMLVGSSWVGKTYILKTLVGASRDNGDADAESGRHDESEHEYIHVADIGGERVKLTIFDTRGVLKNRPHCLWRCQDNSIDAFILVFSLFDSKSLHDLQNWVQLGQSHCGECRFFLIANSNANRPDSSRPISVDIHRSEVEKFLRLNRTRIVHYFDMPAPADQGCIKGTFDQVAQHLLSDSAWFVAPPHSKMEPGPAGQLDGKVCPKEPQPMEPQPMTGEWSSTRFTRPMESSNSNVLGRTQLAVAARFDRLEVVHALSEQSTAAAWTRLVNFPDNVGMTPLMLAAAAGHVAMIVQLYEKGANVHLEDRLKFTALTHAACCGHSEAVSKLLVMGAAGHVTDFCDNTPLIWAARAGFVSVIAQLTQTLTLDQMQHAGEYGMSALQWANHFGHKDCLAALEDCIQRMQRAGSVDLAAGAAATVDFHLLKPVPAVQSASPFYSMQKPMRGYAMIINNIDFPPDLGLARRDGAEVDFQASGLLQAFVKMGLTPKLFQNSGGQFFQQLMPKNCPELKYNNHDAFLLCISSHGGLGFIYASDGAQVLLEDVFDQVRRLPGLLGKPKIFVVQGCRDTLLQPPLSALPAPRRHEDCFYLYSVSEGGKAKRHTDKGCLFTNALRDALMSVQELPVPEFPQLIPQVVDQVACETECRQIVTSTSTLRKLLFFPPQPHWSSREESEE